MLTSRFSQAATPLGGVMALLLTPFDADGAIDWPIYDEYVDWQLSQRPSGLFAVCGTSEMKWLTRPERLALAERAVARASGVGVPVIATANLDPDRTQHERELCDMAETGVTAVVLVPPSGMGRDQRRLQDYVLRLTEKAPCPVILYEWPQVEDYFISPQVFGELASRGRVAGIKDTTCTVEGITAKLNVAADTVVFQANTPYLLESLALGVGGIMAVTSAARCDLVVRLWESFQTGADDLETVHQQLVCLDALLRMAYPAAAKYLVNVQGIEMSTATRWPVHLAGEMGKALEVWQRATPRRPL